MSKYDLQGKVAIVTGGAGTAHGTGRCIALEYAKAGANIVIAGRTREKLDEVAGEIRALGREALAIVTDVTVPEQVDNMVRQTVNRFGRLDILVNNVGGGSFNKAEDISPDDWVGHIMLNLNSTFFCCAAAGKVMIEQKNGKIINISSTTSVKGEPMLPHFAAAKAGVNCLTKSLALGWAQHSINVNCIAPGKMKLPDHSLEGIAEEEYKKQKEAETNADGTPVLPLMLPANPEDIAHLALFLASAAADLITGEIMVIRGAEWASVYM